MSTHPPTTPNSTEPNSISQEPSTPERKSRRKTPQLPTHQPSTVQSQSLPPAAKHPPPCLHLLPPLRPTSLRLLSRSRFRPRCDPAANRTSLNTTPPPRHPRALWPRTTRHCCSRRHACVYATAFCFPPQTAQGSGARSVMGEETGRGYGYGYGMPFRGPKYWGCADGVAGWVAAAAAVVVGAGSRKGRPLPRWGLRCQAGLPRRGRRPPWLWLWPCRCEGGCDWLGRGHCSAYGSCPCFGPEDSP